MGRRELVGRGPRVIVRMLNPAAAQLPAVRRLFLAALAHGCRDPELAVDRTAASCTDPRVAIFIGLEGGEPKALFTVKLPGEPRLEYPLFDLAANLGSRALGEALRQRAVEFTRAAGYDRAWAFNQTGASDAAYIRNARRHGLPARHVVSMIELDLNKEDPGNGL